MYRRILVPLDGSETSERGLREAIRLAQTQRARLVLLHVIDDFPKLREIASGDSIQKMELHRRSLAENILVHAMQRAHAAQVPAESRVLIAVETLSDTIIATATKTGCELIVLGTHGRGGMQRAVMGSVAEGVSRHSPVPVLLVPPAPSAAVDCGSSAGTAAA